MKSRSPDNDTWPDAQKIDAWLEWKKKCALALCTDPQARAYLLAFGSRRFQTCKNRIENYDGASITIPVPEDCWHLFESHAITKKRQEDAKRYKDWIFDRLEKVNVYGIESGAYGLFRDIARDYVHNEYHERRVDSLEAHLGNHQDSDTPLSLEDLVPGTVNSACAEAINNEYRDNAEDVAERCFKNLDDREKTAVLASWLGLSLAHKVVVKAAQCQHTMLYRAKDAVCRKMKDEISSLYQDEDPQSLKCLYLFSLHALSERSVTWGRKDSRYHAVFVAAEEEVCHG